MSLDRWFPTNHKLPNGCLLRSLSDSGEDWQIFQLKDGGKALIAKDSLANRWVSEDILEEGLLTAFQYGVDKYKFLISGDDSFLSSLNNDSPPESKADAIAFAISLRETRKLAPEVSLQDAIYVERYSKLLPTWTVSEKVGDDIVLGKWLTGGVAVSSKSERRLISLMGWLKKEQVKEVIEAAQVSGTVQKFREVGPEDKLESDLKTKTDNKNKDLTYKNTDEVDDHQIDIFRLPGRPYLESFFNEQIVDIIQNKKRYQALGINFPTAIVLHGPPGCGKTFAVDQLVNFLDWPIFYVDSNSVGSPYIHETSKKISEIFDKAMASAPSVIVIDEMESYLSDRQISQSSGLHHVEEVAEFLRRIPEASENEVLIIGMTNRLEMIDPAILRRGRFDHIIEVGMPSYDEVNQLVGSLVSKLPTSGALELEPVINALAGRALSDASFVIREACRLAAKSGKSALDQDCIDTAALRLPPAEKDNDSRPIGFV